MRYSEEELINILRMKAQELGRTPKISEISARATIRKRFGTWNNALKKAGLELNSQKGLTEKEYIELVQKWANENGRSPKYIDWKNDSNYPDPSSILKKYNLTWSEILNKAGYDSNIQMKNFTEHFDNISDSDLWIIFEKEYYEIKSFSYKEFDRERKKSPSVKYLKDRFNMTWNEMKKKLLDCDLTVLKYSDAETIEEIKRVASITGQTPSVREFQQHSFITQPVITKRFGWNEALELAGLEPRYKTPDKVSETNEELLKIYIDYSIKLGKGLTGATTIDLNNSDEIYGNNVFLIRFGTMTNLRKEAGFFVEWERKNKYTKKQLTTILLKEKKKYGRRLTFLEINENPNLPNGHTILRYFRTTKITEVWQEIEKA
ncbi:MAG: hypothetical protein GY756_21375 [bacterium]|nr:hypothetical protein [bacterium]